MLQAVNPTEKLSKSKSQSTLASIFGSRKKSKPSLGGLSTPITPDNKEKLHTEGSEPLHRRTEATPTSLKAKFSKAFGRIIKDCVQTTPESSSRGQRSRYNTL